jgi:hypothetical protein
MSRNQLDHRHTNRPASASRASVFKEEIMSIRVLGFFVIDAILALASPLHLGLLAQTVPYSWASAVRFNMSGQDIQTRWTAGTLQIRNGRLAVVGGSGTVEFFMCGPLSGNATSYATGELVYAIEPFAPRCGKIMPDKTNGVWNEGTRFGVRDNGHSIGPIEGAGTLSLYLCDTINATITAYATGEIAINMDSVAPKCGGADIVLGQTAWKNGTMIGVRDNGHSIGPLGGAGKAFIWNGDGELTGTASAYATGEIVYAFNAAALKSSYWDGHTEWAAGATFGAIDKGHGLGIVSGTGKVDYHDSGAHVSGTATAANGEMIYTANSAATTSPYRDGHTLWPAGTVLGVVDKGHRLGVVSGTGKVDFHDSGAHVTGTATAAHGEVIYNTTNAATTGPYWDGHSVWPAGTVLGAIEYGHDLGVVSGRGTVDYHEAGVHIAGTAVAPMPVASRAKEWLRGNAARMFGLAALFIIVASLAIFSGFFRRLRGRRAEQQAKT